MQIMCKFILVLGWEGGSLLEILKEFPKGFSASQPTMDCLGVGVGDEMRILTFAMPTLPL